MTADIRSQNTEADELDSLAKIEARIDALREQITFAQQALTLSQRDLEAIVESLSGRTT